MPVLSRFTCDSSALRLPRGSSDTLDELGCVEGLSDDRVYQTFDLKFPSGFWIAGHDDNRNFRRSLLCPKAANQIDPVYKGHHQVGGYDIREGVRPDHVERLLAVPGFGDLESGLLEDQLDHKPGAWIVINDKDASQFSPCFGAGTNDGSATAVTPGAGVALIILACL